MYIIGGPAALGGPVFLLGNMPGKRSVVCKQDGVQRLAKPPPLHSFHRIACKLGCLDGLLCNKTSDLALTVYAECKVGGSLALVSRC